MIVSKLRRANFVCLFLWVLKKYRHYSEKGGTETNPSTVWLFYETIPTMGIEFKCFTKRIF